MSVRERSDQVLLHLCGVLEPDEAADAQAFLDAGGADADAALAAARDALAVLAAGLEPVDPGPAVRDGLMARVRSEAAGAPTATAPPAAAHAPHEPVAPERSRWPALALAAGLAAVAGAGITAALLAPERTRNEGEIAALAERIDAATVAQDELREQLEEQDAELAQLEDVLAAEQEVLSLLRSPRLVAATLTPAEDGPRARMFWDWEDYRCYLHATQLPRLREGRTYALWLRTQSDQLIAVTTFQPDAGGGASIYAVLPEDTDAAVWAGITVESEPVGAAPAGPRVLEWRQATPDAVSH